MSNLSNLNGRALEYLITESVVKSSPSIELTVRANESQRRDAEKLKEIDSVLIAKLNSATQTLRKEWLEAQFNLSKQKSVVVEPT